MDLPSTDLLELKDKMTELINIVAPRKKWGYDFKAKRNRTLAMMD